jgi:hypothetical protein
MWPPTQENRVVASLMALGRMGIIALLVCLAAPGAAEPGQVPLLDAPDLKPLEGKAIESSAEEFPFPPGERLTYAVEYWGVPVGLVTIEVLRWVEQGGRRFAHLVATGQTNEFFSAIYPIRDRAEAWVDLDEGRTVRTALHNKHGFFKETYEEVTFDWRLHMLHVLEEKRHKSRVREVILDFGPFVYDTFDVFYAVRALPLSEGSTAEFPVYANRKVYGLTVRVDRTEPFESEALGVVPAVVVVPRNEIDGVTQGDGRGEIWISAEGRHVPLSLRGWFRTLEGVRVRGVRAELVDYAPGSPDAVPFVTRDSRISPIPSRDGKPIWDAPPQVRAVRAESDVEPLDRKVPGGLWFGTNCQRDASGFLECE